MSSKEIEGLTDRYQKESLKEKIANEPSSIYK